MALPQELKLLKKRLLALGFKQPKCYMHSIYMSFIKEMADDVYCYITCKDRRSRNLGVLFTLWVAPPHNADDSFDRLNIGVQMVIYDAGILDDATLTGIADRIEAILPRIASFSTWIPEELESPIFPPTPRYHYYMHIYRLYHVVIGLPAAAEDINGLYELGKQYLGNKLEHAKLVDACRSFLLHHQHELTFESNDMEQNAKWLADGIHYYSLCR